MEDFASGHGGALSQRYYPELYLGGWRRRPRVRRHYSHAALPSSPLNDVLACALRCGASHARFIGRGGGAYSAGISMDDSWMYTWFHAPRHGGAAPSLRGRAFHRRIRRFFFVAPPLSTLMPHPAWLPGQDNAWAPTLGGGRQGLYPISLCREKCCGGTRHVTRLLCRMENSCGSLKPLVYSAHCCGRRSLNFLSTLLACNAIAHTFPSPGA